MQKYTFSIIKPDAVAKKKIGAIIADIENAGFAIVAQRMIRMSKDDAREFYKIHSARPFFDSLVDYMSSGAVVVQVLSKDGDDVVAAYRKLMGATNPADAEVGTLRKSYGASIEENAVHGSDSEENAKIEIEFFFKSGDFCNK
ncbi:Nucleoside diphosphate kinase [Candidatus Fokinia solitaria]|uniref:Nucleoside diphosphate kinase n=1 Tax=Candidatus Fokinia solitaria TaxID=1802984 RepID=A0A2U8BRT6_9RICK|nr:nucleoside-diphosphate kinase [Candidatus Fokinia solitaria]AWD33049.1 Nucleoside diphosphate kinase [Candidatus Fokinia solitaria]